MSEIADHRVRVVIVGTGPAGIGAAIGLAKRKIAPVLLLERWNEAGGVPAKYRSRPDALATYVDYLRARVLVGQQFAEDLLARLARTNVELRLESSVLDLDVQQRRLTVVDPTRGKHRIQADAVVLATGAREENRTERGWIAGNRVGRVFYTMQLLQLLNHQPRLGWDQAAVAGSDLIGHLAAARVEDRRRGIGADGRCLAHAANGLAETVVFPPLGDARVAIDGLARPGDRPRRPTAAATRRRPPIALRGADRQRLFEAEYGTARRRGRRGSAVDGHSRGWPRRTACGNRLLCRRQCHRRLPRRPVVLLSRLARGEERRPDIYVIESRAKNGRVPAAACLPLPGISGAGKPPLAPGGKHISIAPVDYFDANATPSISTSNSGRQTSATA